MLLNDFMKKFLVILMFQLIDIVTIILIDNTAAIN